MNHDTARTRRPIVPITFGFIAFVTALSAVGQFATSVYLPALPAIATSLSASTAAVQLSLTSYFIAFALAQLVYGPVTDRFGRRPVVLFGLVVFIAGSLLAATSGSVAMLIAARAVQAIGACAGLVVGRAVVRDLVDGADLARAMAYIALTFAAVPGLAPFFGGFLLTQFGWPAIFQATALLGIVIILLTYFRLPETNSAPMAKLDAIAAARAYGPLFHSRAYLGYATTTAFALGGIFAFHSGTPALFIGALGVSPSDYGIYPLITVFGFITATSVTARLAGRVSIVGMVRTGLAVLSLAAVLLVALPLGGILTPLSITLTIVLYGMGLGLLLSTGAAAAMQGFPERAGTAAALLGFLHMASGALASAIVSALQGPAGNLAVSLTVALFSAMAVLSFTIAMPPWRRQNR
ncbi:MAG: multidrug effflux MFS transporter [Alphaproteobacteria bacterium]